MRGYIFLTIFMVSVQPVFAEVKASKAFNPDISANFLGLFQRFNQGHDDRDQSNHNGVSLQEAELQMTSDVDPYFRASVLLSVSQAKGSTDSGIEPEEVFFETISLPRVTLKAGKFKAALGKHNQLHTHAFPFLDAPLISGDLLGGEGLNEEGVSAAVLLPTTWFSELTVQAMGTNNDALYNSSSSGHIAPVAYWKNLWDLSDDLTFELGVFGTQGNNSFTSTTSAYGGDLIFKWRPTSGGKYKAFVWQTQYMAGSRLGNPTGEKIGGISSWIQYQFAERWWAQARGEYEGISQSTTLPKKNKQSVLLGFFPSEFSGLRVQLDRLVVENLPNEYKFAFQYNVSIGAHPAHAY